MVSYKLLSFYHEISKPFSECRINLELLLRIDFFTHIYTEEQVEKFNKKAREAKSYTIQKVNQFFRDTKSLNKEKLSDDKPKMNKAKVIIEVPEFNHEYFTGFIEKSMYHSAFSYFETYMSMIIYYVFSIDVKYQKWSDWKKEESIYMILNGRASDRMNKIQEVVKLNHQFTENEIKSLDRFLTVRNLLVHNGGILKPFHIDRLELDRREVSEGMEYELNQSYTDIQGLIEFLTFFDELVVKQYKSIPKF